MIQHTAATPPRIHVRTLCMAWLLTLLATAGASGQCQYEVTAIIQGPPCLGGGFAPLVGRGMNSHGHVVGSWNHCNGSNDEAFYWTPETGLVTMTRPPGVHSATASDINDAGQVIGRHLFVGVAWKGFVYDIKTQQYTYLEPKYGTGVVTLNAINNAGIAVGSRSIGKPGANPNPSNAVIWNTTTGEITDLGVGDGPNSAAMDVNEAGDAVGWTGQSSITPTTSAFWFRDVLLLTGPIPTGTNSIGIAVDDAGMMLGQGLIEQPSIAIHAFVWNKKYLSTVHPPEGIISIGGGDINNVGQKVLSGTIAGGDALPFLWQHDVLYSLATLVNDDSSVVSDRASAMAINDVGQILIRSANTRAAILSPIGQPIGDLNHDCRVDVHDLIALLDSWGPVPRAAQQETGLSADLNGDGVVNVSDLLILLANWSD